MISDVPARPRDRRAPAARAAAALGAAYAVAAIALAGCGGGGGGTEGTGATSAAGPPTTTASESTTTSSTAEIKNEKGPPGHGHDEFSAVNAILASSDSDKACSDEFVTQHYLDAAYGGKQGCVKAQRPGTAARSLAVSASQPASHGHAELTVKPQGGIYDGQKLKVSLVKQNGTWKVDGLKSNAPVGP